MQQRKKSLGIRQLHSLNKALLSKEFGISLQKGTSYWWQIREIGREVVLEGSKGEARSGVMECYKEFVTDSLWSVLLFFSFFLFLVD